MRRVLTILLCFLLVFMFVSCDPDDASSTGKIIVTFVQGEVQSPVEYTSGELLYKHAPDLQDNNFYGHYNNWDHELDEVVTKAMTVTQTDNEGHAVFFLNQNYKVFKVITRPADYDKWTDIKVSDFPTIPAIEGYTGVWERWGETGDITYFSSAKKELVCWYYSNEKFSSTGLPRSYIPYGADPFTIAEYPISGTTNVNSTNFATATDGYTAITSDQVGTIISEIASKIGKSTYEGYDTANKSAFLLDAVSGSDSIGFIKAVKDYISSTSSYWCIPTSSEIACIAYALYYLDSAKTYYNYLAGKTELVDASVVRFVVSDYFFKDSYSNNRFYVTNLTTSGSCEITQWHFYYDGTSIGLLWPVKVVPQS